MTLCAEVDVFSTPSLLQRAAIDDRDATDDALPIAEGCYRWRASSPFSLSDTGRLGLVLSRNIPFLRTLPPCTGTARRSHTPPTILSPEVCRHRRLLQRKTRTNIPRYDPTCHARGATASAAPDFAFYLQPNKTRRRPSIA
jgi:hypothetical protein